MLWARNVLLALTALSHADGMPVSGVNEKLLGRVLNKSHVPTSDLDDSTLCKELTVPKQGALTRAVLPHRNVIASSHRFGSSAAAHPFPHGQTIPAMRSYGLERNIRCRGRPREEDIVKFLDGSFNFLKGSGDFLSLAVPLALVIVFAGGILFGAVIGDTGKALGIVAGVSVILFLLSRIFS
eukprot:gnl/TRDRNA2_/TRDRNA2_205248_c0_seq1.p1 gnl/TRDRNA2_/TRDRNA2_205248_c0~~gnl/TRDRNA2_/TRDRNA2_205248_c0_seq1.p1  ORF type:complete len:182 (+),score=6.63 gnl/TRDRNA2_/TRDRNA2_205248_c0_seq1:95-640(+)